AMIATALDTLPAPPCARLLGWRVLDARPAEGWIRIGFEAKADFCNPAGFIQGGFLAAMLDDTMGPAVFAHTEGRLYTATIDMTVSYLNSARPGPIVGEGQVVQLGKSVGFVEAKLTDAPGELLARATSSVRLIPAEKALA
ncbi:PaaI family thioesterase, partial [Phenylobacterium sp.]|uniref:PaaI family thioesterase n=1 Tax=Phenylobacterium sp. TaxID=1871053 RepID=UPI002E37EFD7